MNPSHVFLAYLSRYMLSLSAKRLQARIFLRERGYSEAPPDGLTTVHFHLGSADKMRSPRFAQMRCIYSGQRQPIMRRASRLHSWDVFAYEPLPNRLRPSDLTLGRLSKETNRRRSGATSRICRRREDSADV